MRPLASIVLPLSLTPACALVLDLDAERDDGGGDGGGGGGIALVGDGGGGRIGDTVGSTSAATAVSTSGQPACDGYATFSGAQLLTVEGGAALDLENELAIVARVKSAPDAANVADYEGFVFSRLSPTVEKGYALVLAEKNDDGFVYPQLRVYTRDGSCACASAAPVVPDTWVNVTAAFEKDKFGDGDDAGLWVDGVPACVVDCGDDKLERFSASPVVGAALNRTSGFFRGAISELAVVRWKNGAPNGSGNCGGGTFFSLSFESVPTQTFMADCPTSLEVTLGASNAAGADDPQVILCP